MAYNANKQPDELTALTSLDSGDVFVVGDVSDAVETAKMITKANLIADLGASFEPLKGADDNFVTDAEKTKLSNLSGTNTGDEPDASTTVAGVVEEATQAEVDAGTATGGTGARLFVNPSAMHPEVLTVVPLPVAPAYPNSAHTNLAISDATTASVGLINIPNQIIVNKVSFKTNTVTSAATLDISLYSEDGQTRLFSVTTASVDTSGKIFTTAVSSVTLRPGNYYLMVNGNDSPNLQVLTWTNNSPFGATDGLNGDIASEPILSGTLAITAGTPPSTISPTGITEADSKTLTVRLDN